MMIATARAAMVLAPVSLRTLILATTLALTACGGKGSAMMSPDGTPDGAADTSSKQGSDRPCTATLSGAVSGDLDCSPAGDALFDATSNQSSFGVAANSSAPTLIASILFDGVVKTGSYRSTDGGVTGGITVANMVGGTQQWAAGGDAGQVRGSFDLSIDQVLDDPFGPAPEFHVVHGTLDVTAVGATELDTTGTVAIHVTF